VRHETFINFYHNVPQEKRNFQEKTRTEKLSVSHGISLGTGGKKILLEIINFY
jgi:hypothetical protein